jgi:hypothetical protein
VQNFVFNQMIPSFLSFFLFLFRRILHELDNIQFGWYSVFIGTQQKSVCSNTFSNNKKRETLFQTTKQKKKKMETFWRRMLNANMSNGPFMLRFLFIYCLLYFPSVLLLFIYFLFFLLLLIWSFIFLAACSHQI